MKFSWDELERIITILEAEMNGLEFDRIEALLLAERLTFTCPDIAGTLSNIMSRMNDTPA